MDKDLMKSVIDMVRLLDLGSVKATKTGFESKWETDDYILIFKIENKADLERENE